MSPGVEADEVPQAPASGGNGLESVRHGADQGGERPAAHDTVPAEPGLLLELPDGELRGRTEGAVDHDLLAVESEPLLDEGDPAAPVPLPTDPIELELVHADPPQSRRLRKRSAASVTAARLRHFSTRGADARFAGTASLALN